MACKTELTVGLTDATNLGASGGSFQQVTLSPDGSRAYVVYTNFFGLPVPAVPAAQFANNVGGKLVVTGTIPADPLFTGIDAGTANPSFTLFSLLDDTIGTPTGVPPASVGRVRIFNSSGAVVASRTFTDVNPDPGFLGIGTFNQIGWSPDGRFFAVQYTLTGSTVGSVTTVVRVLNATRADLPVVASYQVTATSFLNPGSWFRLPLPTKEKKDKCEKKKCPPAVAAFGAARAADDCSDYIALNVSNGTLTPVPDSPGGFFSTTGCPNALQILQFRPSMGNLSLVAQASLPASAVGLAAWPRTEFQAALALKEEQQHRDHDKEHEHDHAHEHDKKCEVKVKSHRTKREDCKIEQAFALIAVSTIVATGTSEVSPFRTLPDGTSVTEGCLGNDAAELRVYAFNGQGLILASAVNTNLRGSTGISFTPDGKYLFTGLRNIVPPFVLTESPEVLGIFKVNLKQIGKFFVDPKKFTEDRAKCLLPCPTDSKHTKHTKAVCPPVPQSTDDVPFVPQEALFTPAGLACLDLISVRGGLPTFGFYSFSDNSQWFVVGGTDAAGSVFTIQLFQVLKTSC